jgi:predicted RNase H-like nuclease
LTNHDDRAALICALTALSVAADDFTAVGDADGWIVLPPRPFVRSWARADLEANAREMPGLACYYQGRRQAPAGSRRTASA